MNCDQIQKLKDFLLFILVVTMASLFGAMVALVALVLDPQCNECSTTHYNDNLP